MLNRLERVIFKCLQAPFSKLQAKGKRLTDCAIAGIAKLEMIFRLRARSSFRLSWESVKIFISNNGQRKIVNCC